MEGPSTLPSYAHGGSTLPLLGQTIGDNLRETAERFGDREALVVCSQKQRLTYRQLWDETTPHRPRPAFPGRAARRPRRRLGEQPRRVGRRAVRHRPRRRHPRQHQPRLPRQRTRVRAASGGRQRPPLRRQLPPEPPTSQCSRAFVGAAPACAERCTWIATGTLCDSAEKTDPMRTSPASRRGCSSTSRSTSSTPPARPARPRERR